VAAIILRVRQRHVEFQIVGRVLQGDYILFFGFVEQAHLPVGCGASEMSRAGFAKELLRGIDFIESLLTFAQFEVGKCEPEVRRSVLRRQL
jgi:hypothetical protein